MILAKTIKGYGLGEAGEGRNITHQQKKLNEQELEHFRARFAIPIPDEAVHTVSFYRPPEDSPEIAYLHERREALGGYLPAREPQPIAVTAPPLEFFAESLAGSEGREVSTTMAFVRVLTLLLKHPELGRYVVPIIPDEARTFGMESLFRQFGIYASQGQLYEPVDTEMFLYYKEAKDGQILEEGITEAGSMASFTAAGTAYANYGVPMIPFFIYYSMFGFQRVGDLIWAFADARGKGFLVGGTAGRTTLAGEGLQHQDGHSHVLASAVPTCASYDPAFAYEIAVIVQDGIRRMYQEQEDLLLLPDRRQRELRAAAHAGRLPRGHPEGHLPVQGRRRAASRGAAVRQRLDSERGAARAGDPGRAVPRAGRRLERHQLQRAAPRRAGGRALEPAAPGRAAPAPLPAARRSTAPQGPIVAATDYMKIVADQVAPWLPGRLTSLGTDGFGRSDNREQLRRHFEVNAESIAAAALAALAGAGQFDAQRARQALRELGVNPEAQDPSRA